MHGIEYKNSYSSWDEALPLGNGHFGAMGFVEEQDVGQNSTNRAPHDVDYSKPMLAYFRSFLKTKYGSVSELRKAWNDQTVSFDTASIPLPPERLTAFSNDPTANKALKYLLDPASERRVVDYNMCMAQVVYAAR